MAVYIAWSVFTCTNIKFNSHEKICRDHEFCDFIMPHEKNIY